MIRSGGKVSLAYHQYFVSGSRERQREKERERAVANKQPSTGESTWLFHTLNLVTRTVKFLEDHASIRIVRVKTVEWKESFCHTLNEESVIFTLLSAIWSNEIKLIANVKNMRWVSWRPLMNFRSFINFIIGWEFHCFYTNRITRAVDVSTGFY